jgi:hypothetical protein
LVQAAAIPTQISQVLKNAGSPRRAEPSIENANGKPACCTKDPLREKSSGNGFNED